MIAWLKRLWNQSPHRGCCYQCRGTGVDVSSPETNGQCWDCYGTGHSHRSLWWQRVKA